ncbi:S8 family serine peptidase [Carboxylicivirga sp. RSCT41]|uniref:S8 family serine peptidase n=1 Tax=Carboxylicivirga agarovorans TaxID=3417570 RepID=UPI003D342B32
MKQLLRITKVFLILMLFLGICRSVEGQEFKKGIQKGIVKVKLQPGLQGIESNLKTARKTGVVITGFERIDKLNNDVKAVQMTRLFPYSPKFENRHRKHGLHLWYVMEIDEELDAGEIAELYNALPEVQYAEPEYEKIQQPVKASIVDRPSGLKGATSELFDDPYLKDQWHYKNTGQTGGLAGADINVENVWKETAGASNVVVAIVDHGIDIKHEDLIDNLWVNKAELNGVAGKDDDGNGFVDDIHGYNFSDQMGEINPGYHGTHVAGTVAAVNNNGIGVAGVAGGTGNGDGVKLMSCDIWGYSGSKLYVPQAFIYSADNGAVISQNSWGYTVPHIYEQAVLDAIDYFVAEAGNYPGSPMRGGVVIFAAGNDNDPEPHYPGAYESAIDVASTTDKNERASYSNYGPHISIAAPGGDMDYNDKSGVLSTMPDNKYGYLDGTSMACPHVAGLAALIVSKYQGDDFTRDDLKRRLITGADYDAIYTIEHNEQYSGKLGVGLIDAVASMQENSGIAPDAIADFAVTNIAQDYAILNWTVPVDEDDLRPYEFELYYSTVPFTELSLDQAKKIIIPVERRQAGDMMEYVIEDLDALTEYYFAMRAVDRFMNFGPLSDVLMRSTNAGPTVVINPENVGPIAIDATMSLKGEGEFTINNVGEGDLKWWSTPRHSSVIDVYDNAEPVVITNSAPVPYRHTISSYEVDRPEIVPYGQKETYNWLWQDIPPYMLFMGETDLSLSNSAAIRYYIEKGDENNTDFIGGDQVKVVSGFNLTDLELALNHIPEDLDRTITIQLYSGYDINNAKLIYEDQFEADKPDGAWFYQIELKDQFYFAPDSYFWVAVHVPAGPTSPLAAGIEEFNANSENCYYSTNMGQSWTMLEELIYQNDRVWVIGAGSEYEALENYITLSPDSGRVTSGGNQMVAMELDATRLANGDYKAGLSLFTNETGKELQRVGVDFTVRGHQPELISAGIVDYRSVFIGNSVEKEIEIANLGYGHFASDGNALDIELSNPLFTLDYSLGPIIKSQETIRLNVRFSPEAAGAQNCEVILHDKTGYEYRFTLYGVGIEPPKAEISPLSTDFNDLTLGDVVTGSFTLTNTGGYPLDYYVPKFGEETIVDVDSWEHKSGYTGVVKEGNLSTPAFEWNDIAATGTDILPFFIDNPEEDYYQVEMGFDFPFFGLPEDSIYITNRSGLLSFDTRYRFNTSSLMYRYRDNNRRYISANGQMFLMDITQGDLGHIYVQSFPDRFVVQYDGIRQSYRESVEDGLAPPPFEEEMTYQIILWDSGDIDIHFKDIGEAGDDYNGRFQTLIAIEDKEKEDGLMLAGRWHYNYQGVSSAPASYNPTLVTPRSGYYYSFKSPGYGAVTQVTNASGTIPAGQSVTIGYTIDTDTLFVSDFVERIGVASNDPVNGSIFHAANLNITSGGVVDYQLSEASLDFGEVFQGGSKEMSVLVANEGKASGNIISVVSANGNYSIDGYLPAKLNPNGKAKYTFSIDAGTLGTVNDVITFTDDKGTVFTLNITGTIIEAPVISSGTSSYNESLNFGETLTRTLRVNNSGKNPMELSTGGTQWLKVWEKGNTTLGTNFDYHLIESTSENDPEHYWFDIAEPENAVQYGDDFWKAGGYFKKRALPFDFNFYGVEYDSLYVGFGGVVTFSDGQDINGLFYGGNEVAPDPDAGISNYIAPFHGFITSTNPAWYRNPGQYMWADEEKAIIQYNNMITMFNDGEPMSFQLILYKDGTIKMLYKFHDYERDYTQKMGIVAMENHDGSKGTTYKKRGQRRLTPGLTLTYVPKMSYTIPAESSKDFDLVFDATTVYGGEYSGVISLANNTPDQPEFTIPATLIVNGEQVLDLPQALELGGKMVIELGNGNYTSYDSTFTVTNTGTDDILIKGLRLKSASAYNGALLGDDTKFGTGEAIDGWYDISYSLLNHTLRPGQSETFAVRVTPELVGDYSDIITVYTDKAENANVEIPLSVNYYNPPSISISGDDMYVYAQSDADVQMRNMVIDNTAGESELSYNFSMAYERPEETMEASGAHGSFISASSLKGGKAQASSVLKGTQNEVNFNRLMAYSDKREADGAIGFAGTALYRSATRFKAPADGFNLTHVQTFFLWEESLNSKLTIEILSGEANPNNSEVLYSMEYLHQENEPAEQASGRLITIELDEEMTFFPNEEFFISITYPEEIYYPQGYVNLEERLENTSYYGNRDAWAEMTSVSGFGLACNLVLAGEETYKVAGWATPQVKYIGSVAAGESLTVPVEFNPEQASQGMNKAILTIATNDPVNQEVEVEMILDKNKGPQFVNDLFLNIDMQEGDTLVQVITASDPEGDAFTYDLTETIDFAEYEEKNGTVYLTLTPGYEDSSDDYRLVVVATDEHGNANKTRINLVVNHTNRAPEMVNPLEEVVLVLEGDFTHEIDLDDYFSDPDGDAINYSVVNTGTSYVDMFEMDRSLVLSPLALGTAGIKISVYDGFFGSAVFDLKAKVKHRVGMDDLEADSFKLYPNPANDILNIQVADTNNKVKEVRVLGISGEVLKLVRDGLGLHNRINISDLAPGIYMIEVITETNKTVKRFVKA